ncbi:MAG TPA: mannosyltransferase family protein [Thermomicrobiales bacterium]|nr:mannosyltransferase family protein [Thermomicrobiales bacterium]
MSTDTARIENVRPRTGRRRTRSESLRDALEFPAIVWLVHFLLVQIIATLAFRFGSIRSVNGNKLGEMWAESGEKSSALQVIRPPMEGWQHWVVEPFRHWDGTWYAWIAEDGYKAHDALAAFFPLYPWLMDIGHRLTGLPVETVGWAISHLAFFGALVMAYKLVRLDFSDIVARWTLVALAVFPTAFFFSAIYTESLFLFLSVTTLWAARKNDWLLAVIVCFFATMTRSAGIMLGAPLAVLFIQQHGWNLRRWFPKVLLGVIPPIGLLIFGKFLESEGRTFFGWRDQQWQWSRFDANPIKTIDCALRGCDASVRYGDVHQTETVNPVSFAWLGDLWDHLSWSYFTSTEFRYWFGQSQVLDVTVTILAFILLLIGLKKLPLFYSAWIIPPMIVPLFAPSSVFPLMSFPRFVLPLVPLFVMAVLLLQPHRKVAYGVAALSGALLVIYTMQFALWYWVA